MEYKMEIPRFAIYLPYIGSAFCIVGFVTCFIMAKVLNHLPVWFIFPPISFLGYLNPEHIVYAICFTTGAICFQVSFCYIEKHSFLSCGIQYDGFSGKWLHSSVILVYLCPLFLTIQAIIPLQSDILDEKAKETIWSAIHQGSAAVLFIITLIHANIVCFFIRRVKDHSFKRSSVICKQTGFVGMIVALVASIIFHPASNVTSSHSYWLFNLAGIAQWIFVASMIIFYSSYTIDFKTKPNLSLTESLVFFNKHINQLFLSLNTFVSHSIPHLIDLNILDLVLNT